MEKGRAICKVLKDIRQKIANENGISYHPEECHHKGECTGTCPGCEKEIRYLEEQLKNKQHSGLGLKVAGIAAGVCVTVLPMAAMVQTESKISPDLQAKTIKNDSIRAVDLTNGHPDAVLLRGQVFDTKTKEPIIGAVVGSQDTKKGDVTDIEGEYAVKALPTDTLEVRGVGYYKKSVTVKELLDKKNNDIYITEDSAMM
ncbi:MAG: carboxypeptidase-like regulatory domain-containing protein, partial [Prevotella sp.]|nr:carboxypeptidase-like regulatory domain-containing protein [Prevotella sp.]